MGNGKPLEGLWARGARSEGRFRKLILSRREKSVKRIFCKQNTVRPSTKIMGEDYLGCRISRT